MLVLSLFPGIGLLDMAFEEEGFCVVRGPDLLWGGDIRRFHPPAGRFDGIIGGPPCQAFSPHKALDIAQGGTPAVNLIPEYERVVGEAQPSWFLMENVPAAPAPRVSGYAVVSSLLDNREDCGGIQRRVRRWSFGTHDGRALGLEWWAPPVPLEYMGTVTANGGKFENRPHRRKDGSWRRGANVGSRTRKDVARALRGQGLPDDFLEHCPLTVEGQVRVLGNGVPLPMGRAVARAVKRALAAHERAA